MATTERPCRDRLRHASSAVGERALIQEVGHWIRVGEVLQLGLEFTSPLDLGRQFRHAVGQLRGAHGDPFLEHLRRFLQFTPQPAGLELVPHPGADLGVVVRLRDEVGAACRKALDACDRLLLAAHEDDRELLGGVALAETTGDFVAVDVGEAEVEQYQFELARLYGFERVGSGGDCRHVGSQALHDRSDQHRRDGVVLDDEDAAEGSFTDRGGPELGGRHRLRSADPSPNLSGLPGWINRRAHRRRPRMTKGGPWRRRAPRRTHRRSP